MKEELLKQYGELQLQKEALLHQVRVIEQEQNKIKMDLANESKKSTKPK